MNEWIPTEEYDFCLSLAWSGVFVIVHNQDSIKAKKSRSEVSKEKETWLGVLQVEDCGNVSPGLSPWPASVWCS